MHVEHHVERCFGIGEFFDDDERDGHEQTATQYCRRREIEIQNAGAQNYQRAEKANADGAPAAHTHFFFEENHRGERGKNRRRKTQGRSGGKRQAAQPIKPQHHRSEAENDAQEVKRTVADFQVELLLTQENEGNEQQNGGEITDEYNLRRR